MVNRKLTVPIAALGGSVATGPKGVEAGIIEVKSFPELRALGPDKVKGKIVFFNRPMDPTKINTFEAYGGAVDQRANGATEAAKLGAVGAIVRSMNQRARRLSTRGRHALRNRRSADSNGSYQHQRGRFAEQIASRKPSADLLFQTKLRDPARCKVL